MAEVASRELRNNTRSLLDRVGRGESLTITLDGRPVAALLPVNRRPRWVTRDEFTNGVVRTPADAGMRDDLADLGGESTADLPFP